MRNAITRYAVIAAAATALALNVPASWADDTGDEDEETPVVQPRRPDPPPPEPRRTETRTERREEPRPAMDMRDDEIVTFATDRELVGRDTENIFGPDTPMIYLGAANCLDGDRGRRSSNGPHEGFWRGKDAQPVSVVSSFSIR